MDDAKPADRSSRRHFVTGGVLAAGWSIAVVVYMTSTPTVEDYGIHDMEHSRKYLRQVELIGGKAGIFANDLREWLAGLLHGQSLAFTIAFITAIVAVACHFVQGSRTPHKPE